MSRIQELYNEIKTAEKKKKDLQVVVKDAYANSREYQELLEKMTQLKGRKKEIESVIRQEYASEFNDLDDIKADIKDTKMVLSDLLWNELMKNNPVQVVDEYNNKYVPNVVVTLKKEG